MGDSDSSSGRETVPASKRSIYAEEPEQQVKMAKTLLDTTPSVKIVVEVPRYVHELLAPFYGGNLQTFYDTAVASAVRHWADLEFDTTSPERLEAYRSLDRLATARSLLSWVSFDRRSLQETEEFERKQTPKDRVREGC